MCIPLRELPVIRKQHRRGLVGNYSAELSRRVFWRAYGRACRQPKSHVGPAADFDFVCDNALEAPTPIKGAADVEKATRQVHNGPQAHTVLKGPGANPTHGL